MHRECLTRAARKVLKAITPVVSSHGFVLAGGTAAALQLGHRLSVDFDFFSEQSLQLARLLREVQNLDLPIVVLQEEPDTLTLSIAGVKVSFFYYPHTFSGAYSDLGGVHLAGLVDIASMKLIAIAQRGAKRDYVDLYFILQDIPFNKIADNLVERFGRERVNPIVIGKALVFFADADADPDPEYLGKATDWKTIKRYFSVYVKQFTLDLHRSVSG